MKLPPSSHVIQHHVLWQKSGTSSTVYFQTTTRSFFNVNYKEVPYRKNHIKIGNFQLFFYPEFEIVLAINYTCWTHDFFHFFLTIFLLELEDLSQVLVFDTHSPRHYNPTLVWANSLACSVPAIVTNPYFDWFTECLKFLFIDDYCDTTWCRNRGHSAPQKKLGIPFFLILYQNMQ